MLDTGARGRDDVRMGDAVLKRVKTSRAVVEYVHQEIFQGQLRPGDRIDVELISATLGVSPTPVREALVLLERDGVITARVHRGAFVERFDERTLRADFHVLGVLSGVAVARVAKDRDPMVVAELCRIFEELAGAADNAPARRQELVTEILRVEHRAGATPRLRAELRGFSGFLESAARLGDRRSHREIIEAQARVIDAIVAGEERRASQCRLADARAAGEEVIREFERRGVLPSG
jgi:DNA-binding GntR family transcriptional regulator